MNDAQGVGTSALALGNVNQDAVHDSLDREAREEALAAGIGMGNSFSIAAAEATTASADEEDPNMKKFIEKELAKRRGAAAEEGGGGKVKTAEDELWETPDALAVRKVQGEETADRWLTGIVEVQLPTDFQLKSIEETEAAKRKMLDNQRRRNAGLPVDDSKPLAPPRASVVKQPRGAAAVFQRPGNLAHLPNTELDGLRTRNQFPKGFGKKTENYGVLPREFSDSSAFKVSRK